MAAVLKHFVKRDNTVRTAGPTAAEITNYTIAWADLTAAGLAVGDDVLVVVACKHWGSSASANYYFAVGFGTTFAGRAEVADSVQRNESAGSAASCEYHWFDRRTLVENENIYFRSQGSAGTASYNEFTCFIIKLGDLTANDFVYAEATHSGDAPDAYGTSGAGATIPLTGDWFLAACSRWLVDGTAEDILLAIHDGTADVSEVSTESEDVDDERVFCTFAYRAGLATSATVRARYMRIGATAPPDCVTTKIFGLRLGAFEDHAGQHTTNTITHSVVDTYQEFAGFGSYGLTTTGPFVVIGWPLHTSTDIAKQPYGRIQIGGADWPAADYNRISVREHGASQKIAPFLFGYNASQSAATLDIDLDCADELDVSPTYACHEQVAVAFSLTLAVAEGDITVNPTVGTIAVAGLTTTVTALSDVAPTTGVTVFAGFVPTVSADFAAAPTTGPLAVAGLAPTVVASAAATTATASITITGSPPTVSAAFAAAPIAGTIAVADTEPTVTATAAVTTALATVALTGAAPSFASIGAAVEPECGLVAFIGLTPAAEGSGALTERLTPNAVVAGGSNLQDSDLASPPVRVADLADETSGSPGPDALWWTAPNEEGDVDIRLAFPPSSGNLVGTQTINVLVRGTSLPSRDVTVELWEAGNKLTSEVTEVISSIDGQVVVLTFEPDDLSNITGADVELRIFAAAA